MNKNSTNFCKIPKSLVRDLEVNPKEILTYYAIDRFRLLKDDTLSFLSLQEICNLIGYKSNNGNDGYLSKARSHLIKFHSQGLIDLTNIDICKPIKQTELIMIKLNPEFFPTADFVQLTDEEFDTLIHIKSNMQKAYLFKVFLFIKTYIYVAKTGELGKPSAFYRDIGSIIDEIGLTRRVVDKCLELLENHKLLIKHKTGSYKTSRGSIVNAPNIYVLNDCNTKDNINMSVERLKYGLKVDKFMPCVYKTKKIRKEN